MSTDPEIKASALALILREAMAPCPVPKSYLQKREMLHAPCVPLVLGWLYRRGPFASPGFKLIYVQLPQSNKHPFLLQRKHFDLFLFKKPTRIDLEIIFQDPALESKEAICTRPC